EGLPPAAVWEALERLNLGRLRLASKGLKRLGDELLEADEAEQCRDGMVMLGEAAALRSATVPLAELHREVAEGCEERLARIDLPAPASPQAEDVAVIGMACLFPDAPDINTFWSNIVTGVDSIREVPRERWDADTYFEENGEPGRKTPSKWGA